MKMPPARRPIQIDGPISSAGIFAASRRWLLTIVL
jgi:hypothetical protein